MKAGMISLASVTALLIFIFFSHSCWCSVWHLYLVALRCSLDKLHLNALTNVLVLDKNAV